MQNEQVKFLRYDWKLSPRTPFRISLQEFPEAGRYPVLDVHEAWINILPTALSWRILYFIISYLLLSLGIALSNRCGLPIVPTDLFPRELSQITKIPYPRIKVSFDVICLAVTAGLTLFFLHRLDGLGVGTILAAFTMGKAIGMVGNGLDGLFRRYIVH